MVLSSSLTVRSRSAAAGRDRLAGFLVALRETPIPTAPPPHDGHQEALGLNLLALALRLGHISRMSEELTLADSTHMARSVSIDVDMTALTAEQRTALRSDPASQDSPTATVWVPVARQARADGAPIVVRNGANEVVPRMTQVETAQALIHGMSKAFRMFLYSDPRTEISGELLHDIRHGLNRSRWLIEATIAHMIDTGGRHRGPTPARSERHRATDSDSIRDKAARTMVQLFPEDSPFLRLLDIAASEYLLVVQVPTGSPQTFLRYDGPVLPARSGGRRGRATIAPWAAFQHEFTVRYSTVIPRAVNSYHVSLEVPPEIQIRRFFLTSDVDAPALRSLINDMRAVAESYDRLQVVSPKLLELELQGIASRLAEFGRRRYRDLESFMSYIEDVYSTFSRRRPRFPARTANPAPVSARESLVPRRRIVTGLGHLAHQYETDNLRKLADGRLLGPADLRRWADALTQAQLHADIYVDNDPRENAGHAHWQRRPFGSDPQSLEPVSATVYMALVDDPPSLASSVSKLLLAVLLLVAGFGAVLQPQLFGHIPLLGTLGTDLRPATDSGGTLSTADAIVTMLLLVPGLLLSRLDIPSGKTVLGRLRLFPRYVAYSSVIIAGALALTVASVRSDRLAAPFLVAIIALLGLAVLVGIDGLTKAIKRRSRVPMSQVSPNWLIAEIRRTPRRRARCAANFSTIGSDDHG
jgi:hypothetical protein